jgi:hypothetical protein
MWPMRAPRGIGFRFTSMGTWIETARIEHLTLTHSDRVFRGYQEHLSFRQVTGVVYSPKRLCRTTYNFCPPRENKRSGLTWPARMEKELEEEEEFETNNDAILEFGRIWKNLSDATMSDDFDDKEDRSGPKDIIGTVQMDVVHLTAALGVSSQCSVNLGVVQVESHKHNTQAVLPTDSESRRAARPDRASKLGRPSPNLTPCAIDDSMASRHHQSNHCICTC